MHISEGANSLIAEAVANVANRIVRQSTKLIPDGAVSVYRFDREVRVLLSIGHESSTGTVRRDGSITWDKGGDNVQ